MEVEAGLVPPRIRLNASLRTYALRLFKLPESHPICNATTQAQEQQQHRFETSSSPAKNAKTSRTSAGTSRSKRQTQLDRISESIRRFVNNGFSDFKAIRPYYFAPWNKNTPYVVSILPLSKEEATTEHNSALERFWGTNTTAIYSDASLIADGKSKGVGVGIVAKSFTIGLVTYESTTNIGLGQLVYNGELEGATQAIEYASRVATNGQSFQVFSDNQAGLFRLKTPSDNPGQACQIRAIAAAKLVVAKGATITLNWVPGHTDIEGNERAD